MMTMHLSPTVKGRKMDGPYIARTKRSGSWKLLVLLCCCCWSLLFVLGASSNEKNEMNNSKSQKEKDGNDGKNNLNMNGDSVFYMITDPSSSSTSASSSTEKNYNKNKNKNQKKVETDREKTIMMLPCLDYVPRCMEYVLQGLCRPYFSSSNHTSEDDYDEQVTYVRNNCRQSCRLCHHHLENNKAYVRFGRNVGVKQRYNFTDSPLVRPLDWGMTGKHKHRGLVPRGATETEYLIQVHLLKTRIYQTELSMDNYLEKIHRPQKSEDASSSEFQVLEESCINRHPFCALWAVRGYCESDAPHMAETCAPICHSCAFLHRDNINNITTLVPHFYFYNSHWGGAGIGPGYSASPFHRYDLQGMIEAIAQDRVIRTDIPPKLVSSMPLTLTPFSTHYSSPSSYSSTNDANDNLTTSSSSGNTQRFNPLPHTFPDHVSHPYIKDHQQNNRVETEKKQHWNAYLVSMKQFKAQIFRMAGRNSTDKKSIDMYRTYKARKRHQPPPFKDKDDDLPPFLIDTIEDDPVHVIELTDFLSKSECRAMLDIVRYRIGVDYSKQRSRSTATTIGTTIPTIPTIPKDNHQKEDDDDDGFVPMSSDARPLTIKERSRYNLSELDQPYKPMRLSSRINVFPTLKVNQHKKKKKNLNYNNQMENNNNDVDETPIQFAPVLERVLKKVELLLGFKANAHIELPVQFTKYEKGGFQNEQSHFMEALKVNMGGLVSDEEAHTGRYKVNDNINPYYDSDDDKKNYFNIDPEDDIDVMANSHRNVFRYTKSSDVEEMEPQTMQNARVFGMVIFLSDVESGGFVTFPNIKNLNFAPKVGKALLFPTSLSLVGENLEHVHPNLDETMNHTGFDNSYLIEDLGSIFRHEVVKAGEKYVLTVYFRRYPNFNVVRNDKKKEDGEAQKVNQEAAEEEEEEEEDDEEEEEEEEEEILEETNVGLRESQFIVEESEFFDHNSF